MLKEEEESRVQNQKIQEEYAPIPLAQDLAREKGIEINYYDVIYKLIDDVKEKMSSVLAPEIKRNDLGKLKVLAIFKSESKGMIIGGKVMEGKIVKFAKADVLRKK